ncbi:hypothetical protein ACFLTD_05030 [Elusimicrobiota bacterium]
MILSFKKRNSGLGLIEFAVSLFILLILLLTAVLYFRQYIRIAMASEGQKLCSQIATAQGIYFMKYKYYRHVKPWVYNDKRLEVDARMNKHFHTFRVYTYNFRQTYVIKTFGIGIAKGIMVVYDSDPDKNGKTDSAPEMNVLGI